MKHFTIFTTMFKYSMYNTIHMILKNHTFYINNFKCGKQFPEFSSNGKHGLTNH